MGAIIAFWQQNKFANAVPDSVGSVVGTYLKYRSMLLLLSKPLFTSVGSTKSRLRELFQSSHVYSPTLFAQNHLFSIYIGTQFNLLCEDASNVFLA
jgi:hypothetical protein